MWYNGAKTIGCNSTVGSNHTIFKSQNLFQGNFVLMKLKKKNVLSYHINTVT